MAFVALAVFHSISAEDPDPVGVGLVFQPAWAGPIGLAPLKRRPKKPTSSAWWVSGLRFGLRHTAGGHKYGNLKDSLTGADLLNSWGGEAGSRGVGG